MCIKKCMGVVVVHHILGRLNVRKEGVDELDEGLRLSGDETIEILNESSSV